MRAAVAFVMAIGLAVQVFRSGIDQVVISVTVHSDRGGRVTGLDRNDFQVFDDGQRVRITEFAEGRRPADLLLLLDVSESVTDSLSENSMIMDELRQEYVLGFTPTHADGRLHALSVKALKPGLTVRARKHYFAAAK